MDMADLADIHIEAHIEISMARHIRGQPKGGADILCRSCGEEIPAQRRRLLPDVSTCVDCAAAAELMGKTQYKRRPN